jgi:hypothetical protein
MTAGCGKIRYGSIPVVNIDRIAKSALLGLGFTNTQCEQLDPENSQQSPGTQEFFHALQIMELICRQVSIHDFF